MGLREIPARFLCLDALRYAQPQHPVPRVQRDGDAPRTETRCQRAAPCVRLCECGRKRERRAKAATWTREHAAYSFAPKTDPERMDRKNESPFLLILYIFFYSFYSFYSLDPPHTLFGDPPVGEGEEERYPLRKNERMKEYLTR